MNKQILCVLIGVLLVIGIVSAYTAHRERIQINTKGYIEQDNGKLKINAYFRQRCLDCSFKPILGSGSLRAYDGLGNALEIRILEVLDGNFEENFVEINSEAKIVIKASGEKNVYKREPLKIVVDKEADELTVSFKDKEYTFDITGNWK